MMKILAAHNHYQQPGGEDQSFASEVAVLKAYGHEVVQYVLHNDAIAGMSRVRVAGRTIWSRESYAELRALIRQHRPDVAHFNNTFPLMSPAAYYAARAEGVPVVQSLRNFRLLCPGALFHRDGRVCEDCLGKIPWRGVVHKCYRGSLAGSATVATMLTAHRALGTWNRAVDAYIALTESGRQKFIAGGLSAEQIYVKPNFLDPDPGVARGSGGYGIFVGRLSPEKGLRTMLRAWDQIQGQFRLKIVGDGPDAELVRQAAAANSAIEWVGRKPIHEVLAMIGDAAFLVFPSEWYETFGRVGAEAYAKGTPVIASDLGAMAELVDHERTGLRFTPGDPADLAAKVQQFLALPDDRRAQMRAAARAEFEAKYTADRNYRMLIDIYQAVLARAA